VCMIIGGNCNFGAGQLIPSPQGYEIVPFSKVGAFRRWLRGKAEIKARTPQGEGPSMLVIRDSGKSEVDWIATLVHASSQYADIARLRKGIDDNMGRIRAGYPEPADPLLRKYV